jgi:hypothetical protein
MGTVLNFDFIDVHPDLEDQKKPAVFFDINKGYRPDLVGDNLNKE